MTPEHPRSIMELLPLVAFMLAMIGLFYWIIVLPTKKRQKAHQDLVASLQEGDEVISAGGIYGRIVKLREETIEVEVAQGVRLKFDRRAIRRKADERDS